MKKRLLVVLLSVCGVHSMFGVAKLTIVTNDGQQFAYTDRGEIAALSCSKTISNLIDDVKFNEDLTIPLSMVDAPCWRIIEQCIKILFEAEQRSPQRNDTCKASLNKIPLLTEVEKIKEVDTITSKLGCFTLYRLINGANFLNISELLDSALNEWLNSYEFSLFEEGNGNFLFNQNISNLLQEKILYYLRGLLALDDQKLVKFDYSWAGKNQEFTALCYSPDSKYIASGSKYGFVKIWDGSGASWHKNWEKIHSGEVTIICYSPNGKYLVTASKEDKNICLWNTSDYKSRINLGHASGINAVTFSPDSKFIASTSQDYTMRLWDAESGEERFTIILPCQANPICYSPDGNFIAVGFDDGAMRIWDTKMDTFIHEQSGHSKKVLSICYSPDGRSLATGSEDKTIRIWDSLTGTLMHELQAEYSHIVTKMFYSPDGSFIACASDNPNPGFCCYGDHHNHVQIWDTKSGKQTQVFKCNNYLKSITYNPDGTLICSSSDDMAVRIWDILTGKPVYVFEPNHLYLSYSSYSPDGNFVAAGTDHGNLGIWDISEFVKKRTAVQRLLLWLAVNKKNGHELILNEPQLQKAYETFERKYEEDILKRALLIRSTSDKEKN